MSKSFSNSYISHSLLTKFSDGFTCRLKIFTRLTNFVTQKKTKKKLFLFNRISYIMNIWRVWSIPVPWLWFTYKTTYFPLYKKNLNAWISAKLGHIKKWNFQKCRCTIVITKKRWPDSPCEHLLPCILLLVLFFPDLHLSLQLISNYLPPQTFRLWDLPRDILEFIITPRDLPRDILEFIIILWDLPHDPIYTWIDHFCEYSDRAHRDVSSEK